MSKFKVGDRVRLVNLSPQDKAMGFNGTDIYIIRGSDGANQPLIDLPNKHISVDPDYLVDGKRWFFLGQLKLVSDRTDFIDEFAYEPKAKEFKVGDVVTFTAEGSEDYGPRCGDIGIIVYADRSEFSDNSFLVAFNANRRALHSGAGACDQINTIYKDSCWWCYGHGLKLAPDGTPDPFAEKVAAEKVKPGTVVMIVENSALYKECGVIVNVNDLTTGRLATVQLFNSDADGWQNARCRYCVPDLPKVFCNCYADDLKIIDLEAYKLENS